MKKKKKKGKWFRYKKETFVNKTNVMLLKV